MADPYAGLGTPEAPEAADPYAGIGKPAPPPRKNQALGFIEGSMLPIRNMGKIPTPFDFVRRPLMQMADDRMQQYVNDRRAQGDVPGIAGSIGGAVLGSAPALMVPGGPVVQGVASGVLGSKMESPGQVAMDATIGGVAGKLGSVVGEKIAGRLGAAVRPEVQALRRSGVKMTPGQIFDDVAREDKMMSRPIVGPAIEAGRRESIMGWNRGTINETLKPLGVKLPPEVKTGHDAVAWAQDKVKAVFEEVVPQMRVKLDPEFGAAFKEAITPLSALSKEGREQFMQIIKQAGFDRGTASTGPGIVLAGAHPETGLTGKPVQLARQHLGNWAQKLSKSSSPWDQEMGRALGAVKDSFDDMLVRQNPTLAPKFEAANQAFRGQVIVDKAASMTDDGVFSTGQAKNAVRQADPSRRKAATARGEAYLQPYITAARKVLPSVVPNSGTADRQMAGSLLANVRGAGDRIGYQVRSGVADLAASLPPEVAQYAARLPKPLGLFGAMSPAAVKAREQRK